jgi:hypothetical protein
MPSLHDSLMIGYSVDGIARTLVFRTIPHQGVGGHFEVRFTDVVAYHLEGDCFRNIISEVLEVPVDAVIRDAEVADLHRRYGWPPGWDPARETLPEFVARNGGRFFQVNCSFGIGGWVAARAVDVAAQPGDAAQPAP